MSSSSARRGWPETCTRWVRSVMTSMPCLIRPLMMRPTAFSLPGMVREEKITRSPFDERDVGMLVLGDARQRRARLALAAGAERQHLVGRQIAVGVDAAEVLDAVEIAGLARDLDDALHGAADHHDLAAGGARRVRDRAQARHIGGEGRDRDAPGAPARSARRASWRRRFPRASGLRAPHWWNRRPARGTPSSPSALSFASSVGGPMTGVGSIFQSPVCSTVPSGRADDQRVRFRDRMGDRDQLDVERPEREAAAERHDLDRDFRRARLARALGLEQRGGERRRVDRHLEPRPQVDERAEMILMGVGEHEADEVLALLDQKADVRQDQVDAGQMLVARERHAEIDREPGAGAARRRGRRSRDSCRSRRRRRAARTRVRSAAITDAHRRAWGRRFRIGRQSETRRPAVIASTSPVAAAAATGGRARRASRSAREARGRRARGCRRRCRPRGRASRRGSPQSPRRAPIARAAPSWCARAPEQRPRSRTRRRRRDRSPECGVGRMMRELTPMPMATVERYRRSLSPSIRMPANLAPSSRVVRPFERQPRRKRGASRDDASCTASAATKESSAARSGGRRVGQQQARVEIAGLRNPSVRPRRPRPAVWRGAVIHSGPRSPARARPRRFRVGRAERVVGDEPHARRGRDGIELHQNSDFAPPPPRRRAAPDRRRTGC